VKSIEFCPAATCGNPSRMKRAIQYLMNSSRMTFMLSAFSRRASPLTLPSPIVWGEGGRPRPDEGDHNLRGCILDQLWFPTCTVVLPTSAKVSPPDPAPGLATFSPDDGRRQFKIDDGSPNEITDGYS